MGGLGCRLGGLGCRLGGLGCRLSRRRCRLGGLGCRQGGTVTWSLGWCWLSGLGGLSRAPGRWWLPRRLRLRTLGRSLRDRRRRGRRRRRRLSGRVLLCRPLRGVALRTSPAGHPVALGAWPFGIRFCTGLQLAPPQALANPPHIGAVHNFFARSALPRLALLLLLEVHLQALQVLFLRLERFSDERILRKCLAPFRRPHRLRRPSLFGALQLLLHLELALHRGPARACTQPTGLRRRGRPTWRWRRRWLLAILRGGRRLLARRRCTEQSWPRCVERLGACLLRKLVRMGSPARTLRACRSSSRASSSASASSSLPSSSSELGPPKSESTTSGSSSNRQYGTPVSGYAPPCCSNSTSSSASVKSSSASTCWSSRSRILHGQQDT